MTPRCEYCGGHVEGDGTRKEQSGERVYICGDCDGLAAEFTAGGA